MRYDRWMAKVTSKGQITLPKGARDALLIREGDRLDVWLKDDSLVLRKSEDIPEAQRLAQYARERLQTPSGAVARVDAQAVRDRVGSLPVDTTSIVRQVREKQRS